MIKQQGQTLLEILLAFGASILVLSAVVLGVTTSLSNTQYTKKQGLANSYAQEGMAIVRKIKDSDLPTFFGYSGSYCIGPNSTVLSDYLGTNNCRNSGLLVEGFSREVIFEANNSDCSEGIPPPPAPPPAIILKGSKVTVKVSWPDSKCPVDEYCHKVELITCFSNIDTKPTP